MRSILFKNLRLRSIRIRILAMALVRPIATGSPTLWGRRLGTVKVPVPARCIIRSICCRGKVCCRVVRIVVRVPIPLQLNYRERFPVLQSLQCRFNRGLGPGLATPLAAARKTLCILCVARPGPTDSTSFIIFVIIG